jgi:hypothetical protein
MEVPRTNILKVEKLFTKVPNYFTQNVKKFSHPWSRFDRLLKNWVSRYSREGGSPESLENTGFLPEFTPVKNGAGMTGRYD